MSVALIDITKVLIKELNKARFEVIEKYHFNVKCSNSAALEEELID